MNESQSPKEQVGRSFEKRLKNINYSWWTTPNLGIFLLLTAILRPGDPTNSGTKIILRVSIFFGVIAILYFFLPSFLHYLNSHTLLERIENGEITFIDSRDNQYFAEDENYYYLISDTSSSSSEYLKTYKGWVQYCEGFRPFESETWCKDWDGFPLISVGRVDETPKRIE